ncbi:MAG: hypothetical protein H7X71_05255 [Chitinophagales bacterium]|nr:hypothetical protein [Chitinophagales bacterium]
MKHILILAGIALISSFLSAQVIGGNGEGFTKVYTEKDIPYLQELTKDEAIAIRWPGGADAKFAFPSLDKPGLGMRKDSIAKLFEEFTDEEGTVKEEALERGLMQVEMEKMEVRSDMLDLIEVSRNVNNFQVIYTLNIMTGNIESNIPVIQTLLDSGVNIIAIVAGNETFSSYNYEWKKYVRDFEPVLKACEQEFPEIPRLLCMAQDVRKENHALWNNQLITYIHKTGEFISGCDVHIYLTNDIKQAYEMHPKQVLFEEGKYYKELDAAFLTYIESYKESTFFDDFISYYNKKLPGKKLYCTEFGDKPAEYWSNTIANAGHTFEIFCAYRNDFEVLLVHNLMGNWLWAARRPARKIDNDSEEGENLNRCHWYSILLANELPLTVTPLQQKTEIKLKGEYIFYFNNAGGKAYMPVIKSDNGEVVSCEIHYVTGKYNYSSAGATGFMAKGSLPNYEVKGIIISRSDKIAEIPYNSFGYIKIFVN